MTTMVISDISDGIASVTLNRPEKLNAINYEMADTFLALLDEWEVDDRARAIILTGAGARAFSVSKLEPVTPTTW